MSIGIHDEIPVSDVQKWCLGERRRKSTGLGGRGNFETLFLNLLEMSLKLQIYGNATVC